MYFSPELDTAAAKRYRKWRDIKDVFSRYLMTLGGSSVIIVIALIAFYLLYIIMPLFWPAHIERLNQYALPGDSTSASLLYALEEQHEVGLRIDKQGEAIFFATSDGQIRRRFTLPLPIDTEITAHATGAAATQVIALGLADGSALLLQHDYAASYPNNQRLITPELNYPLGTTPTVIDQHGGPLLQLAVQSIEDETTFVALTEDKRVLLVHLLKQQSLLTDEQKLIRTTSLIPVDTVAKFICLDIEARVLYVADQHGFIYFFDVSDKQKPRLVQRVQAVEYGAEITYLTFLSGSISILVGDSLGRISQWFPVRDAENNYTLEMVRRFAKQAYPITTIVPEYFRKGFIAADSNGGVGIYHTTAARMVKFEQQEHSLIQQLAIAPYANAMLTEQDGKLEYARIENEHPEISWQSLWGKVWYESREEPKYIWQSSSASSDFEPKFSLTPLSFGSFKAAFYAMLFAIPLAIFGAIYTAYFMHPKIRAIVKPTIEIMEALPTVVLGFLAGLWLAPFVERNLPGIFIMMISIPGSILVAAAAWERLPHRFKNKFAHGWEAILLIPVVIVTAILSIKLSAPVEAVFFDGNMPLWLSNEWGIGFDQRNSLIVGLAMGFAVTPTIFSISEDAIYSVPKHLTVGSLALGATPWQTMIRVVLLTASPGIFSAVLLGLGRAVGETMIVVMATGNTAIMNMNIFEGFRALSANIAVEMPESEVNSTHYRILFLAAFVLFAISFMINTVAEIVRQRLRLKYSTL